MNNKNKTTKDVKFIHCILPIIFLLSMIVYGMIIRPMVLNVAQLQLEFIFIASAIFTISELFLLGYNFDTIQEHIGEKTKEAFPAILMLFSIGLLIGSWVISGIIPMFVYYGIKLINPMHIYVISFILSAVFSVLTGTSWGSAGTIGVVLIAVGTTVSANTPVLAAAIISGCYFGDKMSPLSDTTNMAALGAGVSVYDHVRSMMYTTMPSFIISAIIYFIMGITSPLQNVDTTSILLPTLEGLSTAFNFSVFLFIPPLVVLLGAIFRKPALPTIIFSVIISSVLALVIQNFSFENVLTTLYSGFSADMFPSVENIPANVIEIVQRGGLYSMANAVIITIMVFVYIGSIDVINAMPRVVDRIFSFVKNRPQTIIASLLASALINGSTSNQYATAFIVGDAFQSKYDKLKISRKVLSRSIEDYGTFIEPMLPWTTTGIYMSSTLGVPYADYVVYMFMNMINFIISPLIAYLGIGCFYDKDDRGKYPKDFKFEEDLIKSSEEKIGKEEEVC